MVNTAEYRKRWKKIQPSWRVSGSEGVLPLFRNVPATETWQAIRKGGTVGVYTIMMGLSWWIMAQRVECNDVTWVIEVFTFPRLFRMESMESIRNSIWNPWNECWLRPQPISYSMDIMDSMEQIQFHGISTGIPEKQPYLINKNSGNIENQTPASTKYHVIRQMSNLSPAPCNHLKV